MGTKLWKTQFKCPPCHIKVVSTDFVSNVMLHHVWNSIHHQIILRKVKMKQHNSMSFASELRKIWTFTF